MVESKATGFLRELLAGAATAPEPPPLPALLEAAHQQGVSGLLLAAIEAGGLPWAASLREPLALQRRLLLARTLAQVALATRVEVLLAARGLRTLPLKGLALAETVYELESDRPMSDGDLLVLDSWPAAVGALAAEGFVALDRADHAVALRDPASGLFLELHRSITSGPGLFPHDPEGLWSRRRAGRRQQPFLPSAEDLLVQLALHASFQHGFSLSLVQWLDFRRLLEREPVDAGLVREAAAAARAEAALGAALLVAEAVTGLRAPEALASLRAAVPKGLRAWLAPRLSAPLSFVAPRPTPLARARWLLLAGRRSELLWRTLVQPETPSGDTRLAARLTHALVRAGRLVRR